jgi:hypothetical protein
MIPITFWFVQFFYNSQVKGLKNELKCNFEFFFFILGRPTFRRRPIRMPSVVSRRRRKETEKANQTFRPR